MAKKAGEGQVAAAIRPPDFRGAVQRIRGIKAKKEKIGSVNGEIADIWAKIEGSKVNKTAGKFFAKLDALEPADRSDIIRSLNGLMDAADWEKDISDLADAGTVINGRFGKQADGGGEDGDPPGEPGDEEEEGDEEPASPRRARRGSGIAGLDAARSHLGGNA